jgi:hypothetical protein
MANVGNIFLANHDLQIVIVTYIVAMRLADFIHNNLRMHKLCCYVHGILLSNQMLPTDIMDSRMSSCKKASLVFDDFSGRTVQNCFEDGSGENEKILNSVESYPLSE